MILTNNIFNKSNFNDCNIANVIVEDLVAIERPANDLTLIELNELMLKYCKNHIPIEKKTELICQSLVANEIKISQNNIDYFIQYIQNCRQNNTSFDNAVHSYQQLLNTLESQDIDMQQKQVFEAIIQYIKDNNDKLFIFAGILFENQAQFTFFQQISLLDNVRIIIFNHKNNKYIDKIVTFARENNLNIEDNIAKNRKMAEITLQNYKSEIELYNFITSNINKDKRIGIIVKNSIQASIISKQISKLNLTIYNEFEEIGLMPRLLKIVKIMQNEVDFRDSFISLLFELSSNPEIIQKIYNQIIKNNLVTPFSILNFIERFENLDQETINIYSFIKKLTKKGTLLEIFRNYSSIFQENTDNFSNLDTTYCGYSELYEILFALWKKQDMTGKISNNANIYILSDRGARYKNFDQVFLLNINIDTKNQPDLHISLDSIVECSQNCTIFFQNIRDIIPIRAYLLVKYELNLEIPKTEFVNTKTQISIHNKIEFETSKLSRDFSYKKLKLYLHNQYDFYVKYILGLELQETGFPEVGLAIHNTFSSFVQQFEITQNLDEIILNITSDLEKITKWTDKSIGFDMLDNLKYNLFAMLQVAKAKGGTFSTEDIFTHQIAIENVTINLIARPDLVIFYPNAFEIYDLKSGTQDHKNVTIKQEVDLKTPQLLMYAYIISKAKNMKIDDIFYIYPNAEEKICGYQSWCESTKPRRIVNLQSELENFEKMLTTILKKLYIDGEVECDQSAISDTKYWYFCR